MPTTVTCKTETDELSIGQRYEVLRAAAWGYLICVGRKTGWYSKDHFIANY